MRKICIAVYDEAVDYVKALTNFISDNKSVGADVAGFCQEDELLNCCREKPPDILLLGTRIKRDMNIVKPPEVIWLSDTAADDYGDYPVLKKYQPADDLIRQVMELYDPGGGALKKDDEAASRLISVYSPGQTDIQTPVAVTLSVCLGEEGNTLYVNFRENAGFLKIFREEYSRDLSDLIFLTGRKNTSFGPLLQSMVYREQQLQYLPPFMNPVDISGFTKEEWINFIVNIKSKSGFRNIVADISAANPAFYGILKESESIISLCGTSSYASAQRSHFEKNLKIRNLDYLGEKIKWTAAREIPGLFAGEDLISSWFWGDMGDLIREKIL